MTETSMRYNSRESPRNIEKNKEEEYEEDLEPTAGLSSAASCICFHHADHKKFRPVYTHQSFDGEHIRGYAPLPEAAEEAAEIASK